MIILQHAVEVPYPPAAMYTLINDIEVYPEFVPLCTAAKYKTLTDQQMEGSLTFSWLGISTTFSTLNVLQKPNKIEMHLLTGPFKQLEGAWQFTPTEKNGTKIEFVLKFELKNRFLHNMLTPILHTAMVQGIHAFIRRAETQYGQ